jgi:hypothetical protein
MSFGVENSHEVASVKLLPLLIAQRDKLDVATQLQYLSHVPVMMANYSVSVGWFGGSHIKQRFADLEVCSNSQSLGEHLALNWQDATENDTFAVSSQHARSIRMALIPRR